LLLLPASNRQAGARGRGVEVGRNKRDLLLLLLEDRLEDFEECNKMTFTSSFTQRRVISAVAAHPVYTVHCSALLLVPKLLEVKGWEVENWPPRRRESVQDGSSEGRRRGSSRQHGRGLARGSWL